MLKDLYTRIRRFLVSGSEKQETRSKYFPTENPDSGEQLKYIFKPVPLPSKEDKED